MLFPLLLLGGFAALLLGLAREDQDASVLHQGDQPARAKPARAKSTSSAIDQRRQSAARALQAYLRSSGDFGSKSKPSTRVRVLQALMGAIKADGIDGPETEARARELGSPLPARPKAQITVTTKAPPLFPPDTPPSSSSSTSTSTSTSKSASKSKAPAPAPAKTSPAKGTPAEYAAARALNAYLRSPDGDFGSKGRPSTKLRALQAQMGRITADGIDGPKTTARALELGQTLPARPITAPSAAAAPAARSMITAPIRALPATTKPAAAAVKPATVSKPPAGTAKPAAAATSPATSAARALDAYMRSGGRDRTRIADLQWQLGLDADGIPGAGTRSAVKRQLGNASGTWNEVAAAQLTGGVPGGASKREAAERLERYYNLPGSSRSAARVMAYQRVLGVAADGKVGPQTRSAATAALGRTAKL